MDTKWDSVPMESSKIQASKLQRKLKFQRSEAVNERIQIEVWSFSGAWMDVGAWSLYYLSRNVILSPSLGLEKLSRRVGAEADAARGFGAGSCGSRAERRAPSTSCAQ